MAFKMKGSPIKLGKIQGASGHTSALKDLGHGGHPGLTYEEAAARTHGGKMSKEDLKARQKANSKKQTGTHHEAKARDQELIKRREARDKAGNTETATTATTKGVSKAAKNIGKRVLVERGIGKSRKPTYKEAWDNMTDEEKTKHGSYEAFETKAKEYNAKN